MKLILAMVALCIPLTTHATVELIIAPEIKDGSIDIRRSALFHSDKVVKYGVCDWIEGQCTPETASLVIKRELPYQTYLEAIAKRFSISARYLSKHKEATEIYKSYIGSLQGVQRGETTTEEEKNDAGRKLGVMNAKGGTLDSFTQAISMLRALEWHSAEPMKDFSVLFLPPLRPYVPKDIARTLGMNNGLDPVLPEQQSAAKIVFIYERSMKQYEQFLLPMNFAFPAKLGADNAIDEPSTGLTWRLDPTRRTLKGAVQVCKDFGEGYHLPTPAQLEFSGPWLSVSPFAPLLHVEDKGKWIWLEQNIKSQPKKVGRVSKDLSLNPNFPRFGEVDVYHYTYKVAMGSVAVKPHIGDGEVPTTEEKSLSQEEIIKKYGDRTFQTSVLCVGPTKYEDP